nr:hypothetical protein [Streptomyces fragilis]
MEEDLVRFVRSKLDADEHNLVMIASLAPPGTDVTLDSTIPMIDMVRAVAELYATVAHLEPHARGASRDFEAGWAAGGGRPAPRPDVPRLPRVPGRVAPAGDP